MSKVATATVEVLTAEVRVLMVGSRQVTLSVSRQLDKIPWDQCEPFGRIRDIRDNGDPDEKFTIIGKDQENGQLCRASIYWMDYRMERTKLAALKNHPAGYVGFRYYNGESYSADEVEELEKEVQYLREEFNRQRSEWNALPLIVLAGLK
jgi:HAMP domain-containing protein